MNNFDYNLFPPKQFQIMNYSQSNFVDMGRKYSSYFINELGLKSMDNVLEIGSGNGRIASSLTNYLDKGSYVGVDIMKPFVKWCQEAYRHYDRFSFEHINVYNKYYNKSSFTKAKNFKFPFNDEKFDFIYLTSVFTHMHSEDVDNYLSEINRMLKSGGITLITYFLINEETKNLIKEGRSKRHFRKYTENAYTDKPENPEAAIAYDMGFIESLYSRNNLEISSISLGKWRNPQMKKSPGHGQDRVVAVKV